MIVLDDAGYWDPLLAQLQRMIDERLAFPGLAELWQVTTGVPATIEALRAYRPTAGARSRARNRRVPARRAVGQAGRETLCDRQDSRDLDRGHFLWVLGLGGGLG